MLKQRLGAFRRIHRMIALQIFDQENLKRLVEIQRQLVAEIKRVEKAIRKSKALLRDRNHDAARAEEITERIEELRATNYLWHEFGDAIAFMYLDKYALKQAYYKTQSLAPKQDAGFLSGKTGFAQEIATVKAFARHGIPSLLCDLTNTVRHGDVCRLDKPDPHFIEVKTGAKGRRGRRQGADIAKLHEFFEKDVIKDFRGFSEVHRRETPGPETSYPEVMAECIKSARTSHYAVRSPEEGVFYAALFEGANFNEVVRAMTVKQGVIFNLNEIKAERSWSPYYPFTLSIPQPDDLYDFSIGNLVLLVVLDIELLRKKVEERIGGRASVDWEDDYPLTYSVSEEGGIGKLSKHFLARVGIEFLSLASVVEHVAHGYALAEEFQRGKAS